MADIAKVKRNIGRMIDQNATDAEIEAYMADEGVNMDQLAIEPGTDQPGLMQQAFDVKNAKTGESYIYGNNPEPQPYDDVSRIAADSVSMGYLDKYKDLMPQFGDEQAKTREARRRMGWAGTAVDVGAGAFNPIMDAKRGWGALTGGISGAADAYGHQESWVPDPWNMLKGAAVGSVAGAAGAKAGEMLGGLWGRARAKADQLFKNDDELTRAADDAYSADPGSRRSQDLTSRADRVAEVRAAQGQDRGTFGKMLKGMPAPAAERAAIDAITNKIPGKLNRGVQFAGRVADKVFPPVLRGPAVLTESVLTGAPWTTALTAGGTALTAAMGRGAQRRASKVGAREIDDLLAQMRDPTGKGYVIKQQTTDAARALLAKLGVGAGEAVAN